MTKDKTCTELKFENREIASLKVEDLEFSFIDKNGNIKHKDRLHIPFSNLSGSLKGLKLRVFKNSGNKIFVLNYWFQGKSVYYTIGQYTDTFGTDSKYDLEGFQPKKIEWMKNWTKQKEEDLNNR